MTRVLIVSNPVWQDKTSIGNLLNNMFKGSDFEFYNIYFGSAIPNNSLCKKYYRITDGMVLKNFLKRKPVGESFDIDEVSGKDDTESVKNERKIYSFFHKHNSMTASLIRGFLWNNSKWKNDGLKKFLDDAKPDIIFSFCQDNVFLLRLSRFCSEYTGKKIIAYAFDDVYSLKQFNLSPLYWLWKFRVRREIRETVPCYSLVYTMTEAQKLQFEKKFSLNVKLLLKPVDVVVGKEKENVNSPIKMIYAGGLYLKRWKTLGEIVKAIKKINNDGVKIVLDIYTADVYKKKVGKLLNDGTNSFIRGSRSSEELMLLYSQSDIALHVESFDLKNRLIVKMSFSTKITDCLASGCACMAVCDKKQGGFDYLKKNDLAICVDGKKEIESTLINIVKNENIITDYSKKALEFSKKDYNAEKIRESIKEDFIKISSDESITD